MVVQAVRQINSEGIPFSLWIAYIGSAHIRTLTALHRAPPAIRRSEH
jgi:hypothetical protein